MSVRSRPRDNIELLVICEHRRMLEVLSGGFVHLSVLTEKIKLAEKKRSVNLLCSWTIGKGLSQAGPS